MTANAAHPTLILPNSAPATGPGTAPAHESDSRGFRADQQGPSTGGDTSALALTSFLLGIASIAFGWTFVAPITGLILGSMALRRSSDDRTLAMWGVWLNGIMLTLTALAVVAVLALLGLGLLVLPAFAL